jgi:hypothetical protein
MRTLSSPPITGSGLIDQIYSDSFLNLSFLEKLMVALVYKNRGIQYLINYQDSNEYWIFRPVFVGLKNNDKGINVYDAPSEYRTYLISTVRLQLKRFLLQHMKPHISWMV